MLDDYWRISAYQAQSGRTRLTPRQHRRVNKKRRSQSQDAAVRREDAVKARTVLREERKARRAGLTPRR